MPVYQMSAKDYAKIKKSERHHFIHLNVTSTSPDGSVNMTFDHHVARMLDMDLSVKTTRVGELNHPADARAMDKNLMLATALDAPGFNGPKEEKHTLLGETAKETT